jgi:hypothetical protein
MKRVFISYVSENYPVATEIANVISENGFDVWLDKNKLKPGQRWLDEIRKAIQTGSFFIPLFSKEWVNRERSVANDELLIAIAEMRNRPYDRAWLIPVKINECVVPEIPIGPDQTLSSIHYTDFSTLSLYDGYLSLLHALGIENPQLTSIPKNKSGWPYQLRIIRRDRYVDRVPFRYKIDGHEILCSNREFTELNLEYCGVRTVQCEAYHWILIRTVYIGLSESTRYEFVPGHRYELFVSGDNIKEMNSTFLLHITRKAVRGAGIRLTDPSDKSTWPINIRTHISEL